MVRAPKVVHQVTSLIYILLNVALLKYKTLVLTLKALVFFCNLFFIKIEYRQRHFQRYIFDFFIIENEKGLYIISLNLVNSSLSQHMGGFRFFFGGVLRIIFPQVIPKHIFTNFRGKKWTETTHPPTPSYSRTPSPRSPWTPLYIDPCIIQIVHTVHLSLVNTVN